MIYGNTHLFSSRWEKFAKEKGIKKRKRGKDEWDEVQKEWRCARVMRRKPPIVHLLPFPSATSLHAAPCALHSRATHGRPRHGFERVNDPNDIPIIEAKAWERSGAEDPFALQASRPPPAHPPVASAALNARRCGDCIAVRKAQWHAAHAP